MTYISYVNHTIDNDPKPLTKEILNNLLDANATNILLKSYRETGDERAKKNLPAVLFNGLYSPQLAGEYMNAPLAAGEKPHTRRDAPCFVPSYLVALDMDPTADCTLSAREMFEQTWQRVKETFDCDPSEVIAMAYETPTVPGWRLVVKRTKGLTIAQEQERWNAILAVGCDAKCKNVNRLYYLTTRRELMYLNEDLVFSDEPHNPEDFPLAESATHLQLADTARATSPTPVHTEWDQETLENIVAELEHCVGGGAARQGDRNNQVFRLACLMRYVVGNDIPALQRLIPTYSLSALEHLQAITSATRTTLRANMPLDLQRAIERVNRDEKSSERYTQSTPPEMPKTLPPAIATLIDPVPEKARAAAAISSFAAWRVHLREVKFHYIDNLDYEPCFCCICCANQTEGKTATRMPSDSILANIVAQDRQNREAEEKWREACSGLGANKDRPQAPQLPIRIVEADMTNPALVRRAINAQGYSLYTYAEELEKLNRLSGLSEIIRTAYDGARYGQERVSANAVSQVVDRLRWSFNVSTTPATARKKFKGDLTNGTLTRLSLSTIQSDPYDFGDEMPVYGDFGTAYQAQLAPYVEHLQTAAGTIHCTEAEEWAERERQRQIDTLRQADMRYMVPYMKRSLQMGFWRAMILYVMNGGVWSEDIERFASWSIDYDMWCKQHFFGDMIEGGVDATPDNSRFSKNLLHLLPEEFTFDQARDMRRDIGRTTNVRDVRNMLHQWVHRGFIVLDGGKYRKVESQGSRVKGQGVRGKGAFPSTPSTQRTQRTPRTPTSHLKPIT